MLSHKYLHISVRFLLIFLISLLICYLLPGEISGTINIYVNIEETSTVGASFPFSIGRIVEVILMGPVFVLIYYVLIKNMLSKIETEKGRNKQIVYVLDLLVVVLIFMVVVGHVVHLMFDYANWLYRNVDPGGGYSTNPLFLFLYHSDEWVGHHLIHVGFFGFIILALISEALINEKRKMRWYELIIVALMGVGLFVMSGYATYEGQCGWLLMVLSTILLGIEVVMILIKRINPLKYPILFASVIGNIIIIGYFIWYISVFGTLPYYPFAPQ
ncbi:MAG: hypothetical protein ACTSQ8_06850 [Candidatus Helarchaeota archaeon]